MIEHIEQGTLDPNIRACIALTSWKKRINTVGLTIYNLFETCGPDYHIVLTLAEEEFPKKEQELPRDLVLMNRAGVFEILWCKRNWRSFKKILFAMQKYNNVPIISADDDCLYLYNYADELYGNWIKHKNAVFTYKKFVLQSHIFQHGPATIYPPGVISLDLGEIEKVFDTNADDVYIGYKLKQRNTSVVEISSKVPYIFHDCIEPLSSHELTVETSLSRITSKLGTNSNCVANNGITVELIRKTGTPIMCVFGCLLSDAGKKIKDEMLRWIVNKYDCICVNQAYPGVLYEWPALAFAQDYAIKYNVPVLYVHTKGAFNSSNVYNQTKCRKLWKQEFHDNYNFYHNGVCGKNNIVAGPFIADPCDGHTWLNGFMATPSVWKQVNLQTLSTTRYAYEYLFRGKRYTALSRCIPHINSTKDAKFERLVKYINSL